MWRSILQSVKASLWNVYNETIPSPETIVFAIEVFVFYLYFGITGFWKLFRRYILRIGSRKTLPRAMIAPLKQPKQESLVERIERQTGKCISISTISNGENLTACNPQNGSPLFSRLPMEIRSLIFEFAATQSNDMKHDYLKTAYYYRPGHVARHKTQSAFLLTCRRVWLEANALPMRMAEHSFWFQRGPYDQRSMIVRPIGRANSCAFHSMPRA